MYIVLIYGYLTEFVSVYIAFPLTGTTQNAPTSVHQPAAAFAKLPRP